jgi:CheY-like chemotaxis protein
MFFRKEEDIVASGTGAVLLMEDDIMTSHITTEMLHYLGYAVEAVTSGEEAVVLYRVRKEEGRPFKAVILDIYQPEGIGGEETLRRLLDYDPGVRAIAFSGRIDHKAITDPKACGFRASLPKPYGIRQLGAVLQNAIGFEPGEESLKDRRNDVRHGIVSNFEFFLGDESEDICEGVTTNISKHGFGFLAEKAFTEGQVIVVTRHDVPDIAGRKARVLWTRKGSRHYQTGAKFVMTG